jgi:hypothetical protein
VPVPAEEGRDQLLESGQPILSPETPETPAMHAATLSHRPPTGWTQPLPAALDSPQTLVLAFGASRLPPDVASLHDLLAAFPQSVVVGCSTAGEIAGDAVDDHSLSVAVARFAHTRLMLASASVADAAQSGAAGAALAQRLRAGGDDLRAVFVLSDGLHVNGTPLVGALRSGLGPDVVLSGGLAGDGSAFERTWVLASGRVTDGCVVAVGLYGDRLQVGSGCAAWTAWRGWAAMNSCCCSTA